MNSSRRSFLKGCSAAIVAMSGSLMHSMSFAQEGADDPILLTVFLRGGADVLNMIPPLGGSDRGLYESARKKIHVPYNEALQLGTSNFGLHPSAASLHELYQDNQLAIVQATGLQENTRSHFQAMAFMEFGTPGNRTTNEGWLTRHIATMPNPSTNSLIPTLSAGMTSPQSVLRASNVVTMSSATGYNLNGSYHWRDAQRVALKELYGSDDTPLHNAGLDALNSADMLDFLVDEEYIPSGGVVYPNGDFGDQLSILAQLIKKDVGLRTTTIDLGGWDTHDEQGLGSGGYFGDLLKQLSDGLAAFYADLNSTNSKYSNQVTVVVMSEFGRRLRENGNRGTDHGHGGAMMVLGGQVNGGLYGTWPGLDSANLYDRNDLDVTTDYRQVLSEVLIKQQGNLNIDVVFPQYTGYEPLGIMQGDDATLPTTAKAGDVNCDEKTNLIDIVLIQKFDSKIVSGSLSCTALTAQESISIASCDVNGDNQCSLLDAVVLKQCDVFIDNGYCTP